MRSKLKRYEVAFSELSSVSNEIGEFLTEALKPIIPDLSFSLGGLYGGGLETISFWSDSRNAAVQAFDAERCLSETDLCDVIAGVFRGLSVQSNGGVYLTTDEISQVKDLLQRLLKEEGF